MISVTTHPQGKNSRLQAVLTLDQEVWRHGVEVQRGDRTWRKPVYIAANLNSI